MSLVNKLKTASVMALRLPYHAVKSHRLLWARYVKKQPVVGAIPYELRLHDRYWEKRLGTDTGGWDLVDVEDGMLYEGTPFLVVQDILAHLNLGQDDVFVDLGCGKGRVVCMAARSQAGRVVGVEQSDVFLETARANLTSVSDARAQVDFLHGLAQDFNFDSTTVVFLFNSFGANTLQEVLGLIEQSLKRNPRSLRFVYLNPVHERVLQKCTWLDEYQAWPSAAYPEFEIQPPNPRLASFWKTRD